MSADSERYRVAKENQNVFREAIKSCMGGSVAQLKEICTEFLSQNLDYSPEEFFTGFQSEGRTLLHMAASSGHPHMFQYILSQINTPPDVVNVKDLRGFTPLINATISESSDIMKSLLALGADVNLRNNDGAAAVHFAAGDGSVERVRLLHEAGAQLDLTSQSGSPLHWAAGKARAETVLYLLQQKVDFNRPTAEGLPAVLIAAAASCDKGVQYLVEAGADIDTVVAGGLTTLHICAENGLSVAVTSILLTPTGRKCCAMLTLEGNSPLHLAAMAQQRDVVRSLIPLSDLTFITPLSEPPLAVPPAVVLAMPPVAAVTVTEDLLERVITEGQKRLQAWEAAHQQKQDAKQEKSSEFDKMGTRTVAAGAGTGVDGNGISAEARAAAGAKKELGNKAYKSGDFQLAVDLYTDALYLNKFESALWSNRSAVYLSMGKNSDALRDAEICRQLRPDWVRGAYRLASARLALGLFEDAAVAAFEGVKLDNKSEEMKLLLQKCVRQGQEDHKSKVAREMEKSQGGRGGAADQPCAL